MFHSFNVCIVLYSIYSSKSCFHDANTWADYLDYISSIKENEIIMTLKKNFFFIRIQFYV